MGLILVSLSEMTLYRNKYRIESTRLTEWDYSARGWYFVTICTKQRSCIFGEIVDGASRLSRVGLVADSELKSLHKHYGNIWVDEYVVMPNHVHAIIRIEGEHYFSPTAKMCLSTRQSGSGFSPPKAGSLSAVVRSYKAGVTRLCGELGLRREIWQSRFYDHLLRGDKVIEAVREYIRNNPANWSKDKENPFRPTLLVES